MMRISEDEQSCTDFDWYCVDREGGIGHFTSAGFKLIPPSVAESSEDLNFLDQFFNNLNPVQDAHTLDEHLSPEQRTERYLRSFTAMADRGLYSFDIESYLKQGICYFRVAIPRRPLQFSDMPEKVREILGRTLLEDRLLQQCSEVPYSVTLSL